MTRTGDTLLNEPVPYPAFSTLDRGLRLKIVWAFAWRSVVIAVGSFLGGALAGGIVGFLYAVVHRLAGIPPTQGLLFKLLCGGAGFLVGLYLLWVYVHWMFSAVIAGHRLQLVRI